MRWRRRIVQDKHRINEFLPKHKTFTKDDLLKGLAKKLSAHSEKHFGMGSKMNSVIARKLLDCYTEDDSLGQLGILIEKGKTFTKVTQVSTKGPWKTVEQFNKEFGIID